MSQEKLSPDWDRYYDAFVRDAHQLLAWGYEGARDKISADDDEPVITGRIVAAINNRLSDARTPSYYDRYHPDENRPDNATGRLGNRRRMPDITIVSADCRPRIEFTFEAKRLRANGFPIGDYVGADGLQCFIRGDYAREYEAAAMIAYIQSHTPDHWFKRLSKRLASDTSGSLGIKAGLGSISVIPSLSYEWASKHDRSGLGCITVFHIFLDCS